MSDTGSTDDPPAWGRPSGAASQALPLRARADSVSASFRAEGGQAPWCAVRGASVAGLRHRLAGQPGQDAWGWELSERGIVLAVADGVGSRAGSEVAAGLAVAASCRSQAASPEARVDAANVAVAELAGPADMATTLVVAVIEPDGRFALARVGDSSAFVLAGGAWAEVFGPPEAETVAGATAALPTPEAPVELAAGTLSPGQALVLVTDGVADPLRDGPTTVAPGLAGALTVAPVPLALARVADFSRQGCHDDRTILGLWFTPA